MRKSKRQISFLHCAEPRNELPPWRLCVMDPASGLAPTRQHTPCRATVTWHILSLRKKKKGVTNSIPPFLYFGLAVVIRHRLDSEWMVGRIPHLKFAWTGSLCCGVSRNKNKTMKPRSDRGANRKIGVIQVHTSSIHSLVLSRAA